MLHFDSLHAKIVISDSVAFSDTRVQFSISIVYVAKGGRTKEPILNETKSPILETGQNRRFRKWDKTTDSENETKPPIPKMRQNRRFCKREQIAIKIVSLIKASWPNYP